MTTRNGAIPFKSSVKMSMNFHAPMTHTLHSHSLSSATASRLQTGIRQLNEGKCSAAVESFARVLQRDPKNALARWYSGRAFLALNQADQAIPHLEKAVEQSREAPFPWFDLGWAYQNVRKFEEAEKCYGEATRLKPDWGEAWFRLGTIRCERNKELEAEVAFRCALALPKPNEETHNHLGYVLGKQGRYDEAVEFLMQAIRLNPRSLQAWGRLGNVFMALNRLQESEFAFRRAQELDSNNAQVKWNLSLALLLQGKLGRESWLKYEFRWVNQRTSPQRGFAQPLWQGMEPLAGKSILVHAEQGLGDTLQFVRYTKTLASQGATVHLVVQTALKSLLQGIEGAATVFSPGDPLPAFDLQCPLLSLPFALDTKLDSIPREVPYIKASQERAENWKARLPSCHGLRVGIVWRGSPSHSNDANRSIKFDCFRKILETDGCQFVSLQFAATEVEASAFDFQTKRINPMSEVKSFADTAALVASLDMVITVDTSVAHLAGAMGKPVWVLLPFAPDWRWMLERGDSPWYPTMRLFRQPAIGDWTSVIEQIGAELREIAQVKVQHSCALPLQTAAA